MGENSFSNTMDFVNELNKSHGVNQRGGKKYTQVVHRMEAFRRFHGLDYGVDTNVLVDDGHRVVIKATLTNSDGVQIGSGMAEEIRGQGHVNTTSALENCETSAVGRALASIGLAGGEYASANEIDAVQRKTEAKAEIEAENNGADDSGFDPLEQEARDFWREVAMKTDRKNMKTQKEYLDYTRGGHFGSQIQKFIETETYKTQIATCLQAAQKRLGV